MGRGLGTHGNHRSTDPIQLKKERKERNKKNIYRKCMYQKLSRMTPTAAKGRWQEVGETATLTSLTRTADARVDGSERGVNTRALQK